MVERTLAQKLGLKQDITACVLNAPPHYEALVHDVSVYLHKEPCASADFIHVFAEDAYTLKLLIEVAKSCMHRHAVLWASWPKKASGVQTDLSMAVVRECGLAAKLVDIKICSVDSKWSGMKFVYRVRDRGKIPKATGTRSHPRTE